MVGVYLYYKNEMSTSINELILSFTGKQKEYLDKVVDSLVRDTEIDYYWGYVYYPYTDEVYSFSYTLPLSGSFMNNVIDTFGLKQGEHKYVYEMYKGKIHAKIRKYYVDKNIYHSHYNIKGDIHAKGSNYYD